MLVLVTEEELHGTQPFDAELLDDVDRDDDESNFTAVARKLREQSMSSFKVALADIQRMEEDGFLTSYHGAINATSLDTVTPASMQTALVHSFDCISV